MDKMLYCIAKFCFICIVMTLILSGLLTACRLEGDIEALRKKPVENPSSSIAPSAPATAPTVIAGNGQLTVSWQAVEGAAIYEVWAGTANNSSTATKQGDDVSGLSAVITGLTNNTTYYIWIKAKNSVGTSGFSPVTSGTPSIPVTAPQTPSTPAASTGNEQITVTWAAVQGATAYEVWLSTENNSATAAKHGEDVSGTTVTLTYLTNGTTYYVWLKAKNNVGTSGFSPAASGKPLGTPGAPTVSSAYKQLLVTWTAVPGADGYEVWFGTSDNSAQSQKYSGDITGGVTEMIITGLVNEQTYYVWIRAKNSIGISDYGPSASGVPSNERSPGLYRGIEKIGDQNLSASLSYITINAQTGDDFYIVLEADESALPMRDLSYSGKTVGITLLGYGGERTITTLASEWFYDYLFGVYSGVTLTLDENITLNYGNNTSEGVRVSGGTLTMNGGTISGFHTGVNVSNGTFTMNNGTISGNTARGVTVGGTFTMNGGAISGTISNGGVDVGYYGTFTMNGGTISGNENTGQQGGGISVNGIFTMYNGVISGNTAARFGGGVFVDGHGSFSMHGGVISGNTAGELGGGVFVSEKNTFKKLPNGGGQNSGIIYGNEETGVDAGGAPLKNIASPGNNGYSHAVYTSSGRRNTTAGQTDHIDTTTGRGLSASGNAPFGN